MCVVRVYHYLQSSAVSSLVGCVSVEVCAPLLASSDPIRVLVSRRTRRLTRRVTGGGSLVWETRHPDVVSALCGVVSCPAAGPVGSGWWPGAGHGPDVPATPAGRWPGSGGAGRAGRKMVKNLKNRPKKALVLVLSGLSLNFGDCDSGLAHRLRPAHTGRKCTLQLRETRPETTTTRRGCGARDALAWSPHVSSLFLSRSPLLSSPLCILPAGRNAHRN